MYHSLIRENILFVTILLYIIIFSVVFYIKPGCFFQSDNSIREFGIGYKNKTIFPIWLFSIILGIFSYLIVLYYVKLSNKIDFYTF
jgi:hypothetical protein